MTNSDDLLRDVLLKDLNVHPTNETNPGSSLNEIAQSINLSIEQVEYVGRKFTEIFEINGSSRNGLVMVHGSLFALNSRGQGNDEWREHTAHSIRELLHKWKRNPPHLSDEFSKTYFSKNKDFPTYDKDPEVYKRMVAYYEYFSCICHHEANDIIVCARKLDGELKKCGQDTEEDFLKKVEEFYRFFYGFFSRYTDLSI